MTEISDEQRAAWLRLSNDPSLKDLMHEPGATIESDAALIAPLLPSELTNPQPELPTEPGTSIYGGTDQPRTLFRMIGLPNHRPWIDAWGQRYNDAEARELMGEWDETPPTCDRPQITREQVADHLAACSELPHLSNLDMADSILALVNGTDRD